MKMDVSELKGLVDKQFESQRPMLPLYQTIADHFYPERADFTHVRNIGSEVADLLVDSVPVQARRDLANSFSAMLRDGDWFEMRAANTDPDYEGRSWMEWGTWRLRQLTRDRASGFAKATKQGDHDFAAFGQTVISVEMNRKYTGLLFRSWHLRDCAWWEDETGQVSGLIRRWKTTVRQACDYLGKDNMHPNVVKQLEKNPFREIELYHVCMPSEMYRDPEIQERFPYVSVYLDLGNEHLIEEVGLHSQMYVVPRFQTISGSAYAYSPATVIALPDARTLQAMTHTLLEAAERYARPPIIATQKVVRGDVDLSPDGITWVDKEYDEKMGAALRPLPQDRAGFPIGRDMREGVVEILKSAFYLDTLNLPDMGREMTAFEVNERMKQYRRQNLPLFSPLEDEYNGQLCEKAFDIAFRNGLLGSPKDVPHSLIGADIEFKFVSPLSRSEEEERAQRFQMVAGLLAQASQYDPDMKVEVNLREAFRDAVHGLGAPIEWLQNPEYADQVRKTNAAMNVAAAAMQMAGAAGGAGGAEGTGAGAGAGAEPGLLPNAVGE